MREPGGLEELGGEGRRAWTKRVAYSIESAVEQYGSNPQVKLDATPEMREVTAPDWSGFPARVGSCLTRSDALALLDWQGEGGDEGRRSAQEEYVEWRVQHDEAGHIVAVEMTSELAALWSVIAAYQPQRLLDLVAEFAGEERLEWSEVFGSCDPFDGRRTAADRAAAFGLQMLSGASPYNNGKRAICCMVQRTNTLDALVGLAIAAARPLLVEDPVSGRLRPMTAPEATPLVSGACQDGRSSDPLLLERLGRLAYEGRVVCFDDPLGVYMRSVQSSRLRCPDGRPVPESWFAFSRGLSSQEAADGRQRAQRLRLEVPHGEGFFVSDLIDTATDTPIQFGGQIAELLQLTLYLRVSDGRAVEVALAAQAPADPAMSPADAAGCKQVRADFTRFREAGGEDSTKLPPVAPSSPDRLQEGIYFGSQKQAPSAYRLVLINALPGVQRDPLRHALTEILAMLNALAQGQVRGLADASAQRIEQSKAQYGDLQVLLGFGRRFFDAEHHQPALTGAPTPDYLVCLPRDPGPFPNLQWLPGCQGDGEADLALQLTAGNQAGVDCAAVEVIKLIADRGLVVKPVASFDGFGRPDGRGWLGFHDGVSNMESAERPAAMVASADPQWMAGGTYMAVLRCEVQLARWRALPCARQELLVGRDLGDGGGLRSVLKDADGELTPQAAPAPSKGASAQERADYIDPPQTTDGILEQAHIHRANQNRTSAHAAASLRIFRQGYDYLEVIGPAGPRLGLNFVSFQRNLGVLQALLHLPGWLGDVNFGGSSDDAPREPLDFVGLRAGGLYAIPPRGQPFPGAGLLS